MIKVLLALLLFVALLALPVVLALLAVGLVVKLLLLPLRILAAVFGLVIGAAGLVLGLLGAIFGLLLAAATLVGLFVILTLVPFAIVALLLWAILRASRPRLGHLERVERGA